MDHLKNIHIGKFIKIRVEESGIDSVRICNFFHCDDLQIESIYERETLEVALILKWSKLLNYDFFRLYSQHLIFYSPQDSMGYFPTGDIKKSVMPQFRKNIYTREIIDFILELVESKAKTKSQIIKEYGIPKTMLYKWVSKSRNTEKNKAVNSSTGS